MATRNIYLKIEQIANYNPVDPQPNSPPPRQYRRDCMRNAGHDDGTIPESEVTARALAALIYREYLDPTYAIPKPNKIVLADINEPAYYSRVPGTVIYAHPGDRLHIHVLNGDVEPHSFHLHGLSYGIDSDGAWPLGTQASDGRRSDEICPGQTWTYTYDVKPEMLGAWPFHDHYKRIGQYVNRGLFGGLIVRRAEDPHPPEGSLPEDVHEFLRKQQELGLRPRPVMQPDPNVQRMRDHLKEFVDLPANRPVIDEERPIDVPIFFHAMAGSGRPAFSSPVLSAGDKFDFTHDAEATYNYHCNIHQDMRGTVVFSAAAVSSDVHVLIEDEKLPPDPQAHPNRFNPATATVQPGGTVHWEYPVGDMQHTVTEDGSGLPSLCLNGRSFVGNTPTIVAHTGQKIRWYVFNLDLGMVWHNFHPHAQRWTFADATVDVRSLSPAESFALETIAPPVLLLPQEIEKAQEQKHRPKDAKPYKLRGDFLVHCHVEPHMMQGLACLVRCHQTVWLTPAQADALKKTTGLPLDLGDNKCPSVDLNRCATAAGGKWEALPGAQVTMMHAALLPNTTKVLFWGFRRLDQSRIWDYGPAGGFLPYPGHPANQPSDLPVSLPPGETRDSFSNLHSTAHAFLDTPDGTLLVHGGETAPGGHGKQSYTFNPATERWARKAETTDYRFYSTTLTLADGRVLTLFGNDDSLFAVSRTIEVYDPTTETWSVPPKALPASFDYLFYPWTYLLPNGDLFIAGPQGVTRRFHPHPPPDPAPIIDDPAKTWTTHVGTRSTNAAPQTGSSVLLPLHPPNYEPRVLIVGGKVGDPTTEKSTETIDLSVPAPTWTTRGDLNYARHSLTAVLLPDGRVVVVGGIEGSGGPVEIFDPQDPGAGWLVGPSMSYVRAYHSTAILLADGSVLAGGDPPGAGGPTPHERYFPNYCFLPRPTIDGAPASIGYGGPGVPPFTINTRDAPTIAEVVLVRPSAATHGFNQSQRLVGCAFVPAANSLSVQAPPNGNVAPPGWYLLFIVNAGRVPSVAKWIRLTP